MQKIISFISNNKEIVACSVLMFFFTVLSALLPERWIFPAFFVLFLVFITYIFFRFFTKMRHIPTGSKKALSTLTVDALMQLSYPVLIVSQDDSVVWYNKAFSDIKELSAVKYGHSIKEVLGGALCYSVLKNNMEELIVDTEDKSFSLCSVDFLGQGKQSLLTVWNDRTDLRNLQKLMKMRNVVVGYAAVDNAAEVASYLQEQYRSMVAKAYTELYNWVSKMNGIMREYERDKYIIFVDEEHFSPNIAKKFDILDRVNTAVAGDSNRLTMSMSFAVMEGSLAEKEVAAKDALDYAFQRGGAQIIVKSKDGNLSFGGQSRAVEKTTKIKSRVTADRLKDLMSASSNVLIMGHKNIDFDAFSATCAAARLALSIDKKVNIVINPSDVDLIAALQLIKDLSEYEHMFIDAVRGQELLSPLTLVVVVDASNPDIFESFDIYDNAQNVAIIDHHVQKNEFQTPPKLQYIDPTASSTSELMCEILEQAIPRNALKAGEAELLLAGILLDTQRFTRNTGVRTFGAAMYLKPDAKMLQHAQSLFNPNIQKYTKQAVFQKNTIVFRECIGISYFEDDNLTENRVMASISAESMLTISGIKAAFALCTINDNIHISARSDGSINVSQIAEKLGGGGRFEAAAAVISDMTMKEAMTELRKAIDEYWENKNITGGTAQ